MNLYESDLEHVYNIAEALRAKLAAPNLKMLINEIPDVINALDPSSSTHIIYPYAFVPVGELVNWSYKNYNGVDYIITNNIDNIPYECEQIFSRGIYLGTASYNLYLLNAAEEKNVNTIYIYSDIEQSNIYINNLCNSYCSNFYTSNYINDYDSAYSFRRLWNDVDYNLINNRSINLNAKNLNRAFIQGFPYISEPNYLHNLNFIVDDFWLDTFHNYFNLFSTPKYLKNNYIGVEECGDYNKCLLITNRDEYNKQINNCLILDAFNFSQVNNVHFGTPLDVSLYEKTDISNGAGKAFTYITEDKDDGWLSIQTSSDWSFNRECSNLFNSVKNYNLFEISGNDLSRFNYASSAYNMFSRNSNVIEAYIPPYAYHIGWIYSNSPCLENAFVHDFVRTMPSAFANCPNLKRLRIGKNVNSFYNALGNDINVEDIDVYTKNCYRLISYLYGDNYPVIINALKNIKNIYISEDCREIAYIFNGGYDYSNINICFENISAITNMTMFANGAKNINIQFLEGDFKNVIDFTYAFSNTRGIKNFYYTIDNKESNMFYAFYNSDIEDFSKILNVKDLSYAFYNCKNLKTKNTFCPDNTNNCYYAFYNSNVSVGGFGNNITYLGYAYQYTSVDNFYDNVAEMASYYDTYKYSPYVIQNIGKFNNFIIGENVRNVSYHCCGTGYWNRYFPNGSYDYNSVQGENIFFTNIDNVVNMAYFANYSSVRNIQCPDGKQVENMYYAFTRCGNLISKPGCGPNVKNFAYAYQSCYNIKGKAACGDNVDNMYQSYQSCYNLTKPACGKKVVDMFAAYSSCYNLRTAAFGESVKNIAYAYSYCYNVAGNCTINFIGNEDNTEVNGCGCFSSKNSSKALNIYMYYNSSWGAYIRNGGDLFGSYGNPWTLVEPSNPIKGYYNSSYNVNIRFFEDDSYPFIPTIEKMIVDLPSALTEKYMFNNFIVQYNSSMGIDEYGLERQSNNKLYLFVGNNNYAFGNINNAFNNCQADLSSIFVNHEIWEGIEDMNNAFYNANVRVGIIPSTVVNCHYTYYNCQLMEEAYINGNCEYRQGGPLSSCINVKKLYFNNTMLDSGTLGWMGCYSMPKVTEIELGNNCYGNGSGYGFQGLFSPFGNLQTLKGEIPSSINYLDSTFYSVNKLRGNLNIVEAINVSSAGGCLSPYRDNSYRLNVFVKAGSITNTTISQSWYAFTSGTSSSYILDEENNCYYDDNYNLYVYYI